MNVRGIAWLYSAWNYLLYSCSILKSVWVCKLSGQELTEQRDSLRNEIASYLFTATSCWQVSQHPPPQPSSRSVLILLSPLEQGHLPCSTRQCSDWVSVVEVEVEESRTGTLGGGHRSGGQRQSLIILIISGGPPSALVQAQGQALPGQSIYITLPSNRHTACKNPSACHTIRRPVREPICTYPCLATNQD